MVIYNNLITLVKHCHVEIDNPGQAWPHLEDQHLPNTNEIILHCAQHDSNSLNLPAILRQPQSDGRKLNPSELDIVIHACKTCYLLGSFTEAAKLN